MISNITQMAKIFWCRHIEEGDIVVDATLGRGHDTKFLRDLVGATGKVYAFDIQEAAIESAKSVISEDHQKNIQFILDSHAHIERYVQQPAKAVIFNLGYLPGGSHEIRTEKSDSLEAMRRALILLCPRGILSVAAYLKHDDAEEYRAVRQWMQSLDAKAYKVIEIDPINQDLMAPKLLICQKMGLSCKRE